MLVFALLAIAHARPARGLMAGAGRADQVRAASRWRRCSLRADRGAAAQARASSAFGDRLRALACVLAHAARCCSSTTSTTFWHDSIAYQSDRTTPFSVWGLWGGLGGCSSLLAGRGVALAIGVAFVPASRATSSSVAALGAAVIIALQLGLNYWLYLLHRWFLPLVAGGAGRQAPRAEPPRAVTTARPSRPPAGPIRFTCERRPPQPTPRPAQHCGSYCPRGSLTW